MIRVGISSCFFHPDPDRSTFGKKTLLYYEQSMAHWVMNHKAYPILLPTDSERMNTKEIMEGVEGLILHGGADLAPQTYNENPISAKWPGDALRDKYEIQLYETAKEMDIPILGVCRGMQLINVAEGGTLFQDISTQDKGARKHRDALIYDDLFHEINIEKKGCLAKVYANQATGIVNSVHHQAIKHLGTALVPEAFSSEDGIIEALRIETMKPEALESPFVLGVQWHPEFMQNRPNLLSEQSIMKYFLSAIKQRQ